jgi:hypothetical protein
MYIFLSSVVLLLARSELRKSNQAQFAPKEGFIIGFAIYLQAGLHAAKGRNYIKNISKVKYKGVS